jgi:hypothetical protein
MHKDYISKYPDNSEIRRNKVEDFKRNSRSRQAMVYKPKPIGKGKAVIVASYKITEILGKKKHKKKKKKKKKPFDDGNVIIECIVLAGDYLMNLETKLEYAVQLKRSSYFKILSLGEWNVCLTTLTSTEARS